MNLQIFEKTEKGTDEIARRTHQLVSRQRTLLLLIDGKKNVEDLLQKSAGLGLKEDAFAELLTNGFIRLAHMSQNVGAESEAIVVIAPAVIATLSGDGSSSNSTTASKLANGVKSIYD